jgi:hypothetical protein
MLLKDIEWPVHNDVTQNMVIIGLPCGRALQVFRHGYETSPMFYAYLLNRKRTQNEAIWDKLHPLQFQCLLHELTKETP